MSYTINLTNGTKLTDIIDGSIDQTATDLTLIGKNLSNYGTFYNDNLVHLLENFANVTEPNNPITGQLWYDTSANILKIYNGVGFAPTGNTIVSSTQPTGLSTGGLWINNTTGQIFFNDGSATILAGPIYTKAQGKSGFEVVDVIDTNLINHSIVKLFVANTLIGIYSDASFTPAAAIAGYAGSIGAGFNVGSNSSLGFNLTASRALKLFENDIEYTPGSFLLSDADSSTTGQLVLQQPTIPLVFGNSLHISLETADLFEMKSVNADQNIQITTYSGGVYKPSLFINADSEFVGVFTNAPTATLDVNGSLRVRGDMTVEGDITSINQTQINIEDILISLGKTETPSNTTADGGGILLEGGTDGDKTWTWDLASESWSSSENISLAIGKNVIIDGEQVLSKTTLGSSVTTATGLTQVGTLIALNVSHLALNLNTISSTVTDEDIVLAPNGTGAIDASLAKITNVGAPTDNADAATKLYVDERIAVQTVAISLDTTGLTNAQIASTYLDIIFKNYEHIAGAICRAVCTASGVVTIKEFELSVSGFWEFKQNL